MRSVQPAGHGVDTGIVRIFNTYYEPRMRPYDGRASPTFIRQGLAGILALARSGHAGPVDIGNPHEWTIREIAEAVIAATGAGHGSSSSSGRSATQRSAGKTPRSPGPTWAGSRT